MSVSLRKIAVRAAATVAVAGGLTLGSATMASASDGWVIYDTGNGQCSVLVSDGNGGWSHWWADANFIAL